MKQHLFFIKITLSNYCHYYYSMIYNLEKIESTTKSNIVTIVKSIVKEYNLFKLDNASFFIQEITTSSQITELLELNEYTKNLIYFNKFYNRFVFTRKNTPDYNILNVIKKDLYIKIMIISNSINTSINDNKKREKILDLFELYYHVRPRDLVLYIPTNEKGTIEVKDILNCIPKEKNTVNTLILQDNIGLSVIKEFADYSNDFYNIDIFTKIKYEYYKTESLCDNINFKRIDIM